MVVIHCVSIKDMWKSFPHFSIGCAFENVNLLCYRTQRLYVGDGMSRKCQKFSGSNTWGGGCLDRKREIFVYVKGADLGLFK